MRKISYTLCIGIITLLICLPGHAQDKRTQYPTILANSYFGINIGYTNYNFTREQLEPGFTTSSIHIPHAGVKFFLGHQFNKYLSAELSYMRPIAFIEYRDVNGAGHDYEVGMNVAGLTVRPALPVSKNISITGEIGLGVVTRGGFIVINTAGVKDIAYASALLGGGIEHHINNKWDLTLNAVWSPANEKERQPSTVFYSVGCRYTMRPLSKEKVERNANSGFIFPLQVIQVAFTSNAAGYGANEFVSKDAHIFWAGAARVSQGISFSYQRNIFHVRKVFSLDWGANISYWQSEEEKDRFFTMAIYPALRFTVLRSREIDAYIIYSLAGPALISQTVIDKKDTGKNFTFQDFMGIGLFAGKKKKLNVETRIAHYSNGNIFPQNNGVMIPLTLVLGYSFD